MDSKNMRKQIQSIFDDISKGYDEDGFFALSARIMVGLLPLENESKILDLSTGTGAIAIEIAKKYPQAPIEAIDLSAGMLAQARAKIERERIKNIAFHQCRAEDMPYDDHTFDIITCGYSLFFYSDVEKTYQSICKKIKPGGVFVFSLFTADAFAQQMEIFLRRLEREHNVEMPSASGERPKTIEQIEEFALLSNPRKVDLKMHPIRYTVTVDEWWSLLNNSISKIFLDQLSKEELERFRKNHIDEMKSISNDGLLELNGDTHFVLVYV